MLRFMGSQSRTRLSDRTELNPLLCVFLRGEFYGQRYLKRDPKELDTANRLTLSLSV